jgi:hypothetical protein
MTDPPEPDPLDEVMETYEEARPHRREHAKADPRPDDEELARRTNLERDEVGLPEQPDDSDADE